MNIWQSLTGRLFRLVFGGYVILAILVTGVQLALEYSTIQSTVGSDLISLGNSFKGGVTGAMWELDRSLLNTMAQGIVQSSVVTGVKITSEAGVTVATAGTIPSETIDESGGLLAPFQYHATRLALQTPSGMRALGQLTLYADRSVALERIRYSFFVILINSLIKTAGLWLIFYLVISKGLARPLSQLTKIVSQIEFAAASKEAIALDYPHQDELGRLMGAMHTMQGRLSVAHEQLEQVNRKLEYTVSERTQHLSEALDFNKTILLNSPLPMGVYAASGQCILANEALAQLVGASRDALLQQNFHHIASWRASGLLDSCLSALAQQRPEQLEVNTLSSFGKKIWLDCRILPTSLNGETHLLIQFVDLTEHRELEQTLREYASHDFLTKLPNRRLLLDRLGQALRASKRQNRHGAVLYLDLDQFKKLNDSHGHDVGDQMLIEVAQRLQQAVRDSDTIARLGGDEFVVLLEALSAEPEQARAYASFVSNKIQSALSVPYQLGELTYPGSASIGIRLFLGDQDDIDQLLRDADLAMYQVKRQARPNTRPEPVTDS